jgi:hypothetical protein
MEQSPSSEPNRFAASQQIPRIYVTRNFITVLTSARHLSLSWGSLIHSIMPLHPTSWRSTLMLSSHLRLGHPSGLFPSGFPTKTLYTPLLSPTRATFPVHLILLDVITWTILHFNNMMYFIYNILTNQYTITLTHRPHDGLKLTTSLHQSSLHADETILIPKILLIIHF